MMNDTLYEGAYDDLFLVYNVVICFLEMMILFRGKCSFSICSLEFWREY
jgi:hypothetical protein